MIRILDNVLDDSRSAKLLDLITKDTFTWHLTRELIQYPQYKQYEHYQHYHTIYNESHSKPISTPYYSIFSPIIQSFISLTKRAVRLSRCKLNLLHNHHLSDTGTCPVHIDNEQPHISMIYYINDSDGDTVFFRNDKEIQRVQPVKNRLVVFEGPLRHCSNHPKNHEHRFVMNTVLLTK